MSDYTLSARATYNGSNFDKGVKGSENALTSFKNHCSAVSIAAGNIIADIAQNGFNVINRSMDAAISRVDSLNQFPKVMKNLGYETDVSKRAISELSEGIDGLPTTLDEIVGNTQSLVLSLRDMDKAKNVALALNDGFLTFGASSGQVTNAITQLNQMITANKYDMQSWNSINQSAPGFLDAVARSMLGAEAKAANLREALNDGSISSEDFLNTIVKLDKEGGEGIVAFSKSASDAVGGIQTSMDNAHTAVTKNLANMIDAVNGSGAISKFFDEVKGVVNDVGKSMLPAATNFGSFVAEVLDGKNETVNSLMEIAGEVRDNLAPTFGLAKDTGKEAFETIAPIAEEIVPIVADITTAAGKLFGVFVGGAGQIIQTVSAFGSEARAAVSGIYEVAGPAGEALDNLVDGLNAGDPAAQRMASSLVVLAAGVATGTAAIKKNADGVSLWDRLTGKLTRTLDSARQAASASVGAFTKYQTVMRDGQKVYLKWNSATQSYVQTQKTLPAVLAASTAGVKAQQAAIKVHSVVTKATTVAANGLKTALKTIAPIAIITGVMELANALGQAKESAETFTKATSGFKSMDSYSASFGNAAQGAANYGSSLDNTRAKIEDVIASQAELADSLNESWSDVGAKNGQIEQYKETIARLADTSLDTAEDQGALIAAVEGINKICGTSFSVIDAQNGKLSENKDQILAVASAWQEQAIAQAASNATAELMEQHLKNTVELQKATENLAKAQEGFNSETDPSLLQQYQAQVNSAQAEVDRLTQVDKECTDELARMQSVAGSLSEAYASTTESLSAFIESNERVKQSLTDAGIDASDFASKLSEVGISTNDLTNASDEAIAALVACYQNGWHDVKAVCDQYGIEIPASVGKTAQDASTAAQPAEDGISQPFEQGAQDATAAITNEQPNTANAMAGLVEGVDYEASRLPEKVTESTVQAGEGIVENLNAASPDVSNAASGLVDDAAAEAAQMPGTLGQTVTPTGSELANGIYAGQNEVVAAADAISKLVADHFSSASADAWWAGNNMTGQSYKQGIDTGRDAAVSAADTVSKQVADHFSSSNGDAWWAGRNMAQGMADGIYAGQNAVVNAAVDVVKAANAAAKAAANEHSPSKIWKQIGIFMPKGAAIGIDKGGTDMVKAARSVVKDTNKAATSLKMNIPMFEPVSMPYMSSRTTFTPTISDRDAYAPAGNTLMINGMSLNAENPRDAAFMDYVFEYFLNRVDIARAVSR